MNRFGNPGTATDRYANRAVGPRLVQGEPALPDHLQRAHVSARVEPGGIDQQVEFVQGTVGGDDAAGLDVVDRVGDHLDAGLLHGTVEISGENQPLAHRLVLRGELGPQPRITY